MKRYILSAILAAAFLSPIAMTSDHADTHILEERPDAKIGDFYVFSKGDNLVLVMTLVVAGPHQFSRSAYAFKPDVVYRFHIDRSAEFTTREGTIWVANPADISDDVLIEVRFDEFGWSPKFSARGLAPTQYDGVQFYAGLRDDPFIRGGLEGRNVGAIVVELPMSSVITPFDNKRILAWATTDVEGVGHSQDELAGNPYTSQSPTDNALNYLPPSQHASVQDWPDVLIFDTTLPAEYPNGRALEDDVVDIIGIEQRAPFPTENDVPFLEWFPYLAPHHAIDSENEN